MSREFDVVLISWFYSALLLLLFYARDSYPLLTEKLRTFNPAANAALHPDLVAFLKANHEGLSAGNRLLEGVKVCTILDSKVLAECRALRIGFYDRIARLLDEGGMSHYFTLTGGLHLGSISRTADEHG